MPTDGMPDALELTYRLLSRVQPDFYSGCWNWLGARDEKGYGRYGKRDRAYRLSHELLVGPIPDGLHVDHLCRNTACVNPDHLDLVTAAENNRRRDELIGHHNARKTHCKHGHAYSAENTYTYRGRRTCRTCHANRARERHAAR